MTLNMGEMRGLRRHILLDAVQRNVRAFNLMLVWEIVLGGAFVFLTPDYFPWFPVLMLCWILPWSISLFRPDNRFLASLPLSRSERGQCIWLAHTLDPLLALLPLLIIALNLTFYPPYGTSIALTAAVSFPLMSTVDLHVLRRLQPITLPIGNLPFFLALLMAIQYVNYLLYWRLRFPWLFLLLAPFSVLAVIWSYRRSHLLERVPLPCRIEQPPAPKKLYKGHIPRGGLIATVIFPAFNELASLTLFLVLLLLVSIFTSEEMVFMAGIIPGFTLFGQAALAVWKRLQLLRVLPLSRTKLAGVVMAYGVGAAVLQLALIAILRRFSALPMLSVNHVLLLLCGGAFFPALQVLFGTPKAQFVGAPFILAPIAVAMYLESEFGKRFMSPAPLPSVLVATMLCVTAGFFLLRYALLRPRLDWRYVREVQELAARGNTT